MPKIIPSGFGEILFFFTNVQGHACSMGLATGLVPGTITQAEFDTAWNDIIASMLPFLSTVSVFTDGRLIIGDGTSTPPELTPTTVGYTGARSSDTTPPNVQAVCKKTSGFAGRNRRGRTFLPDILESQVDNNGTLNGTALGLYNTFCAQVLTSLSTASFTGLAILHADNSAPTFTPNFSAEPKVATLRRRFTR